MGKMKRLIVAVVIFTVIVVMALRGCPRVRRSASIAGDSATTTGALLSQASHLIVKHKV